MAWFNYNGRGGEGREGEGFLTREHTVRVKLFVLFLVCYLKTSHIQIKSKLALKVSNLDRVAWRG
ncbi:hypothetical protein HanPSC8_Chr16g0722061 [Helianthus annuus]|nr:hypothetical protein HanPSC8_Chr16g0722061 [Helianthus annuus]